MMMSFAVPGVFLLAYAGFTLLAHAMDRHYRQLCPGRPLPAPGWRAGMRLTGWLLLALSFWSAMQAWGTGNGAAAWFGVASITAALLIWMLPYRPRWVVPIALYGTLASLLLFASLANAAPKVALVSTEFARGCKQNTGTGGLPDVARHSACTREPLEYAVLKRTGPIVAHVGGNDGASSPANAHDAR